MRDTFWGYWLVLLGILIIGVMLLVNNITSTTTEDYYSVKEVTQASLVDALDYSYYRLYGNVKISEQKFVENFLRRFAENVNLSSNYEVGFYDLYEVPPKVSVRVSTKTGSYNIGQSLNNSADVVTTYSAILELGSFGDSESTRTSAHPEKPCLFDIHTELMKYLKGINVNGHSMNVEGKPSIISDNAINELNGVNNLADFKAWFNENVNINGMKAKDALAVTKYDDLPSEIKTWFNYEWITIHKQ